MLAQVFFFWTQSPAAKSSILIVSSGSTASFEKCLFKRCSVLLTACLGVTEAGIQFCVGFEQP